MGCGAPAKKTRISPLNKRIILPETKIEQGITYHQISFSFLYNALIRDINNSHLSSSQAMMKSRKNEILDLREGKDKSKRFSGAHLIDLNKIDPNNEDLFKQLRILYDFKKLYLLTDSDENKAKGQVDKLVKAFKDGKIQVHDIYIPIYPISLLLINFPFLAESYKGPEISYPIMLFEEWDFPQRTEIQGPFEMKKSSVFIQNLSVFEEIIKNSSTTYCELMGFSLIIVGKTYAHLSTANFGKTCEMGGFDVENDQKELQRLKTKVLSEIKRKGRILIIHDPSRKDITLKIFSVLEQVLFELFLIERDISRQFFGQRVPHLMKHNTISISANEGTIKDEKIKNLEDTAKKQLGYDRKLSLKSDAMQMHNGVKKSRLEELKELFIKLQTENKAKKSAQPGDVYEIIRLLLDNIIKNPSDEKFRSLKKDNKRLAETLFKFNSAKEIIKICGFVVAKDDENKYVNSLDLPNLKFIKSDFELAYKLANK